LNGVEAAVRFGGDGGRLLAHIDLAGDGCGDEGGALFPSVN